MLLFKANTFLNVFLPPIKQCHNLYSLMITDYRILNHKICYYNNGAKYIFFNKTNFL